MNRRNFLKIVSTITVPSLFYLPEKKEYQWINITENKPPLHQNIILVKYFINYSLILLPDKPRIIAEIHVGQIIKYLSKTSIHMTLDAYYRISKFIQPSLNSLSYYSLRCTPLHLHGKKLHDYIEKYYAKNIFCIPTTVDPHKERVIFHILNTPTMKTYWTYQNKLPTQLPYSSCLKS